MSAPRVTINDLAGAADWLRAYENTDGVPIGDVGPGDDERAVELLRVAAWLDAEIARRTARRERERAIRAVAEGHGVDPSNPTVRRRIRAALRRAGL